MTDSKGLRSAVSKLILGLIGLILFAGLQVFAKSQPPKAVVTIESMQFNPKTISVSVGQEIEWINQDLVPHTVTARGGIESKSIAPGGKWTLIAKKKGHFDYKCSFHPTMSAAFDVK